MESTKVGRLLRAAQAAKARRNTVSDEEGTESGFTLIELMVVLLIMAILMAIAIPTFLGVKGSAQDRAAQSDLSNALISAKAVYANSGSYPVVASLVATLNSQEPEMSFVATSTTAIAHQIEVAVSTDGQAIILVDYSQNAGNCWAVSDNDSGAAESAGFATVPSGDNYLGWTSALTNKCSTTSALLASGADWTNAYPTTLKAALP
jgi:type IV pilus assembly protein PilA